MTALTINIDDNLFGSVTQKASKKGLNLTDLVSLFFVAYQKDQITPDKMKFESLCDDFETLAKTKFKCEKPASLSKQFANA